MTDYTKLPRHHVLCIDMKSFFATVECLERGYNPLKKKLAVVGKKDLDSSVVLTSTQELRKLGIRTGSRLYEIKALNDPSIVIVQARMGLYQARSNQIREIFEQFVPPNHIDIYSIDEAWLTLDGTERMWGNAWQTADMIRNEIKNKTGLIASVGIGDNKFLAKVVLDNYGKYEGIAECRYEDVTYLLHSLPVEDMWGIGSQMMKNLHKIKIYTIGDLARANPELLKKQFGVNGVKLHAYANGIDLSPVVYKNGGQSTPSFSNPGVDSKSVGKGITLCDNYRDEESILLVIRELLEEISFTLRERKKVGNTIHLTIEYSRDEDKKGFSRQKTISHPSNETFEMYKATKEIFYQFHEHLTPVRKIRISIGNLEEESDIEKTDKRKKVSEIQDLLNQKFGKGTIQKASSLQEKSIVKEQNKKIRGHYE